MKLIRKPDAYARKPLRPGPLAGPATLLTRADLCARWRCSLSTIKRMDPSRPYDCAATSDTRLLKSKVSSPRNNPQLTFMHPLRRRLALLPHPGRSRKKPPAAP